MFKTKRDVDRHVLHILNRIREEKERNARGFQFAKLYYDIADHDSAKRYLQAFLSVRETVPQAHKLMGQIHEAQRNKTRAIESFKRSLELDPGQKDLILKVCDLYCDPSVSVSPEIARYWVDQAEKYHPGDHSVFKLKERMVGKNGDVDRVELEQLISSELLKSPHDVQLHVKLVQLYIENREVDRAYNHAINTEKTLAFVSSIDWYECLASMFQVYEDQCGGSVDAVFHTHKLFALTSLAYLRLQAGDREMPSCVMAMHQLDMGLIDAGQMRKYGTEWEPFLAEMKGQFFFLIATLLLKRAAKGQLLWKDACLYSAVCYLLSESLPAIDVKSSWMSQLSPDRKKFYDHIYMSGCDRLSQGGHMINTLMGKQDGGLWARKLHQRVCTAQGREALYGLVFTIEKLRRSKDRSYLMQSDVFTDTNLDVPSMSQIVLYDSVGYALHGDNLSHVVWLCQQHYSLHDDVQPDYKQLFGFQPFKDMKYSVPDLSSGDPGSLCQLDVQVFLYACVRWTAEQERETRRTLHPIPDKPSLLPVCLCVAQCSRQQCDWWSAVHRMENKTATEKLSKLWGIVMRGLETVRLVSPNTLPLPLIVHMARTLDARAKETESLDAEGIVTRKLSALQDRASFYWKSASDLLSRINRNQVVKLPKESLFPGEMVPDPAVVKEMTDQVHFAMATVAMREERYEDALKGFEMLYQPEASYYVGLICHKLAESRDMNSNSLTSPQASQEMALLTRAKNALYQALDRLGTDKNEKLKEVISQELDDVACRLIATETAGVSLGDSIVSYNSQNYSTAESEADGGDDTPTKPPSLPPTPVLAKFTRTEAPLYPSPTRLDVQLKAIESAQQSQSGRMSSLEETVRTNQKLIQELIVQLRESRDENKNLRDQLQMMSYQQGLAGMSMPRSPMPPFPATPQSRPMMNQSFGNFDIPCPGAIPNHMSQYGYQQPGMASPSRPGSQFAAQDLEDELRNIDGEYYDPDTQGTYYVPDSNLVQDWPFGNDAGVEGKSTITYSPQAQGRVPQNNANMANALRGPSIQYSGLQSQTQGQLPMPGPGFFAQNRQPEPVQSGFFGSPGQTHGFGFIGSSPGFGRSPALSPALQLPSFPTPSVSQPAKPPMMPPNAIASPSVEAKPRLIPGSVGVPPPQKGEKAVTQSAGTSAPSPFVAAGTADSQKTTSMTLPSGSSPGVASSMLTAFASKHQQEKQQPSPIVTQTPQKTPFQGFSFTSTPKISEQKDDKPPPKPDTKATPVSSAAPKPFSNFSLTPSASSKETSVSQSKPAGQPTPQQPHATGSPFVLGQGTPTLSFGSLTSSSTEAFKASGDFSGFQGAGQQVFSGKSPSPRKGNRTLSEDDKVEEYEPNVDFKPVVDLPDLVDVKTGEEEEQKLFGERAKLFRFDTEANQWKERGIGEFKLLKHKETGRVRILMRREQVLKLCANHIITKTMTLSPMSTSDKTWCWHAMDYAEEEMKMENFAIKFKSAQSAQKFKDIFEKCQTELPADETDDGSGKANKPPAASKPATGDLSGMFKQQSGSWKCDGCLINNEADVLKCLCCDSLKPGVKAEDVKDSKPTGFGQATSSGFGSTPASGFTFGTAASSQESLGFKFGSQSQPDEQSSNSQAALGFKFGTQPKADNQPSNSQTGTGFTFGSQPHPDSTPSVDNKDKGKDVKDKPKEGAGSLSSMFQKSDGSWKCDGCLISNNADIIKCPCCGTVKPGAMVEDVKPTEQAAAGSGFSFASNKAASSDQKPGEFTFGSQTQSGSQPSGFLFGSKKSETSKKQLADDETNAAKTTTDVSFPEACKPDIKPGPKFSFGGGKSISESTSIASSAGFSFNKNDSKYTFDTTAKDSTQSDEKSGTTATVEEDSILLKLIQAPSSNTVQEVTERRSSQSETSKAAGSNVDNVGSQNIGGFGVVKNETKGTEQTSDGFVFGGAGGNKPGFAFGSTNKAEGFKFSLETDKNEKAAPEGFSFNQGNQKPAAQSGFNFSLSMTPTSKSVAPKSPGVKSPQSPEVDKDGLYINKEDDDSHIYFEPVIALPDAVDVVTGEEEEEVLFDQRAKLYRFHDGEWRERGLGNMKVLYCQSSEKTRILMRREQILKICCNHYITPELKLMPMPNSDGRALVWYAMDFADDEPRPEQFSIRFKTAESAKEFEKTVKAAKHSSTDTTPPVSPKIETVGALSTQYSVTDSNDVIFVKEETATSDEVEKARKLQLPDNFYVYRRRKLCQGCIGCNDGEGMLEGHGETVDCTEDYTEEDEYDEDEDDDDDGEDSDGYETEEEETDEGEGECGSQDNESGTTYLAKLLSQEGATAGFTSKPTGGLFSGGATVEQDVNGGETPATEGFVFGKAKTAGFSFASLAASADPKAFSGESDPNKPFHWQGAGKQLFGAGAVGADAAGGDDNEGVQQGDDPHFEPIVPLPDLIDVKTGEEDEVVEFSSRAKLFRFDKDANQWKEKGIGEMKILRHKVTDKYRFLLRREQVHKLACNHGLTAQIVVTRMNTSETTWCWTAQDYTETEPRVEQFAVKFKTIELAEKFKGKVDAIQERLLEAGS